jgi:hypothetical protein
VKLVIGDDVVPVAHANQAARRAQERLAARMRPGGERKLSDFIECQRHDAFRRVDRPSRRSADGPT